MDVQILLAFNYDPLANTDDGTCITLIVNGCTDYTATNYNAAANTDDGTCTFLYQSEILIKEVLSFGWMHQVVTA